MAKLTKLQRRTIENAVHSINRTIRMIESNAYAVCLTGEINSEVAQTGDEYRAAKPHRAQEYTGRDGSSWSINWIRQLQPIDKGIGSDLVGMYTARQTLETMLESN